MRRNLFLRRLAILCTAVYLLTGIVPVEIFGVRIAALPVPTAHAATGIYRPIHYQGKVSLTNGTAVSNGSYNMRFKIYDATSAGTLLWTETWSNATTRVTMTGGLFSVALGTHVTMTGSVNFNTDNLYLQVEFDPGNDGTYEEVFSPRRRFASVPYAHNADALDGLDSTKFVRKDQNETMSGSLTVKPNDASKIGIDILSTAASNTLPGLRISTAGANHILFGTGGTTYDVNLYRFTANVLKTDDSLYAVGTLSGSTVKADGLLAASGSLTIEGGANIDGTTFYVDATNNRVGIANDSPLHALDVTGTIHASSTLASSGTLVWEGAGSGSSLYIASSLQGAGLTDCDVAGSSKLLWDAANGRFSCGTDQTGGGSSFSTGNVLTIGDARFVKKSGDTMTGALTINITSGNQATLGLKVINTASGAHLHAEKTLSSSGTLVWEGAGSGRSLDLAGGNVTISTFGNTVFNENGDRITVRIEGDTDQYLFTTSALTDKVGIGTSTPTAKLDVRGVISGSLLTISSAGSMGGSGFLISRSGSVVFNELSRPVDFRIEGDTDSALFFLDASTDRVGIGKSTPRTKFEVSGYMSGTLLTVSRGATMGGSGFIISNSGSVVFNELSRPVDFRIEGDTDGALFFLDSSTDRIGIGTLNPDAKLDVIGTMSGIKLFASTSLASSGNLVIESHATGGSGVLTIAARTRSAQTGAYISGTGAPVLALESYTQSGAQSPHILFGYRGNFDTKITRHATGSLLFASQTGTLMTLDSEMTNAKQNVFKIITDYGNDENLVYRISASGAVYADSRYNSNGADYAEWFRSVGQLSAGEVVCIDVTQKNTVKRCDRDGDSNVMGIISSNPGFVGNVISGADGIIPPGYSLVGLIGQVPAKVTVENGPIRPGDSLTAASIPGFARKANAGESTVGVALEPLEEGTGVINVLISRRNQSVTVEAMEGKILETIANMEIEDEVELMVAGTIQDLDVEGQIQSEVERQLSAFVDQRELLTLLQAEVSLLKEKLGTLETQSGSTSSSFLTEHSLDSLTIEDTLVTGKDARIGGDLHLDGALHASQLFVPGGLTIDGGVTVRGQLDTEEFRATHAAIDGTLTMRGNLLFESGSLLFGSGAIHMQELVTDRSLVVMGEITIHGLATFLGDLLVKGELVVTSKQAGFALIHEGDDRVSVPFGTGFHATPVITASPDIPVLYAVSQSSATGFTIRLAGNASEDIRFSWHALATDLPLTHVSHAAAAEERKIFPLDSAGIPVSSSVVWNACIRNVTLLDETGQPLSCARYHSDRTWSHPDLGIDFLWNASVTPPILEVPEGYETQVTEDANEVTAAFKREEETEPTVAEPVDTLLEGTVQSVETDGAPESEADAAEDVLEATPSPFVELNPIPSEETPATEEPASEDATPTAEETPAPEATDNPPVPTPEPSDAPSDTGDQHQEQ